MKHVRDADGEIQYSVGSDNIFADLGLPNADRLLAKTDLAFQIGRIIEQRGLTQAQAAVILGIDQPKVSALVRGQASSVSMERLYRYLNELGSDVDIVVRPKARKGARGAVRVITVTQRHGAAARTSRKRAKPRVTKRP